MFALIKEDLLYVFLGFYVDNKIVISYNLETIKNKYNPSSKGKGVGIPQPKVGEIGERDMLGCGG